MPGIVLSAGNIAVNKAVKVPVLNYYLTSQMKLSLHRIWAGQYIGSEFSQLGAELLWN